MAWQKGRDRICGGAAMCSRASRRSLPHGLHPGAAILQTTGMRPCSQASESKALLPLAVLLLQWRPLWGR